MYRLIFLLLSVGCFTIANAAEKAGSVVLSVGKNVAQVGQGEVRPLKRQSVIFTNDTITTAFNGVLQLRFTDNSRLSLKKDTVFKVEEYRYDKAAPEEGKAVYKLIKGGLRTITGAISDANPDSYSVKTPIATIGVRGTHYSLFFCDRTCNETTQAQMGLYGYVLEGTIVVGSESITAPVQSGQFFFLGTKGSRLKIQKKPFELFEKLDEDGVDLLGSDAGVKIPAVNEIRSPLINIPRGQQPTNNYP